MNAGLNSGGMTLIGVLMWFNHYQKLYNRQSTKLVLVCPNPHQLSLPPSVPQPRTASQIILGGGAHLNCDPVMGNPSEITPNAQKRVEMTLNNDIISRAAIKQINCHAHRAKISSYPVYPSFLPESLVVMPIPRASVSVSGWFCSIEMPPPKLGGELQEPWCLVYRSRYVNRFYTIKSFLIRKNKWRIIWLFSFKCFLCARRVFFFRKMEILLHPVYPFC